MRGSAAFCTRRSLLSQTSASPDHMGPACPAFRRELASNFSRRRPQFPARPAPRRIRNAPISASTQRPMRDARCNSMFYPVAKRHSYQRKKRLGTSRTISTATDQGNGPACPFPLRALFPRPGQAAAAGILCSSERRKECSTLLQNACPTGEKIESEHGSNGSRRVRPVLTSKSNAMPDEFRTVERDLRRFCPHEQALNAR